MNTVNRAHARTTYRHGDLRTALIRIGVDLAATGGPPAVVLREAARRAGVSASAAYRHFANHQDLLAAVRHEVLERLADHMRNGLASLPARTPATARLAAAGRAYFEFAVTQSSSFACLIDAVPLGSTTLGKDTADPLAVLQELLDARRQELLAADRTDALEPAVQQSEGSADHHTGTQPPESDCAPAPASAAGTPQVDPEVVALWAPIHGIAVLCSVGALACLPADDRTACFDATLAAALRGIT